MTAVPHALDLGDLRRVTPIDAQFGEGRGQPVDRHYIERFLAAHASDIRGRVLEVATDDYTRRFGGSRVTHSDVIHADAGNPKATIVADLAEAHDVGSNAYDCFICTQILTCIYSVQDAVETTRRILRPGGVLLVTCRASARAAPMTATAGASTGASPRSRCAGCCANRFRVSTSGSRHTGTSSPPRHSCRDWQSKT